MEVLSGVRRAPWHSQLGHRRKQSCQAQVPTPVQSYLAIELQEVLRHAAHGKDLSILSWNDRQTSVTTETMQALVRIAGDPEGVMPDTRMDLDPSLAALRLSSSGHHPAQQEEYVANSTTVLHSTG